MPMSLNEKNCDQQRARERHHQTRQTCRRPRVVVPFGSMVGDADQERPFDNLIRTRVPRKRATQIQGGVLREVQREEARRAHHLGVQNEALPLELRLLFQREVLAVQHVNRAWLVHAIGPLTF